MWGCGSNSDTDTADADYVAFTGTVSNLSEHSMTVNITEGDILNSSDLVVASFPDAVEITAVEGDTVQIWYDSDVTETYPAEVSAVSYEIVSTEEPEASNDGDVFSLSSDTPLAVKLSSGTKELQVTTTETGGNVFITLSLGTETVEIGEFGRLGDAYLLTLSDNRCFVLLDADYASDDFVTFLYEITDGTITEQSRLEDVSLQSVTVSTEQLNLRVHVEVFGSYDSYMDYEISESGTLEATGDIYEIPVDDNEWRLLTVIKEVPVYMNGEDTVLPVGSQIRIIGTDNQSTAYFRVEDTGEEGSITYTRGLNDEDIYTLFIDGCSEYDYFDMLPYAG